jgi:hypothetical protein
VTWRKIHILVEGQTEERFVKTVLQPVFEIQSRQLQPVIIATKRVNSGGKFKGGIPGYAKVRTEVLRLLNDSNACLVTTMVDFYGLPSSFPGRASPVGSTSQQKVRYVQEEWERDISNPRFRAYLSLHEFEALLFAAPLEIAGGFAKPELEPEISAIRRSFATPEDINDNPDTAPSKRLQAIYPRYSKPFFGSLIAGRIGLDLMRSECPHFRSWLAMLEQI